MIIRIATPNDFEGLKTLWLKTFGDEEGYIDRFLREKWQGDSCLVVEKEGAVASMLFLLHAEIITDGKRNPVWYVYACATLPEYQGRGYMQMLIEEAYCQAVSQSVFALILVPANESLFLYYEKMGFQRLYKKPVAHVNAVKSVRLTKNHSSDSTLESVLVRRDTLLTRELDVCWDFDHLRFVVGDCENNNGGLVLTDDGYLIYSLDGNQYLVKEQLPEMMDIEGYADYAMIRFCESYDLSRLEHLPYFNLALD